jgi:hypothetical protein
MGPDEVARDTVVAALGVILDGIPLASAIIVINDIETTRIILTTSQLLLIKQLI